MPKNPFKSNTKLIASDELAGVHPKILENIGRYSEGFCMAYGDDVLTERVEKRFAELFEHEVAVFMLGAGSAANSLALSQICPPFGGIYTPILSHVDTQETGAPEHFTRGAKLIPCNHEHGKLDLEDMKYRLAYAEECGIHYPKPSVVTLTNQTEFGTHYTPDETRALSALAHEKGMKVFLDGARFANAVAAHDYTPAELTWKAGVDVMNFGATKGGAIAAEAVIFFNPDDAKDVAYRRKNTGQLFCKMRFIAAQFEAFLDDDLWLKNARHANTLAKHLSEKLGAMGVKITHPTEGNQVFVELSDALAKGLYADGWFFYPWWPPGNYRFVMSWATSRDQIDAFLDSAKWHIENPDASAKRSADSDKARPSMA